MKKESKKLIAVIMSLTLGLVASAANFTYAADTAIQETGNGDSNNESATSEAVAVEAVGLKSAYATGESISIKARVINKSSESLRFVAETSSFRKAGAIDAKLTDGDGRAVRDNYFASDCLEYPGYLNVNEYIERKYVYDMGEVTPGAYTLEVSFYYEDDNDKTQKVSKKYPVEIGTSDGTKYEEDEVTGGAVFLSDKAADIKEYTNELDRYPVKYFPIKLYEYPGAKYYAVANSGWYYALEISGLGLDDIIPTKVYTDEDGKVWGYIISEHLPNKAAWYCMSNPRENLTNFLRGDANIDEKVDLLDATMVLKMAVGIKVLFIYPAFSDIDIKINADVNEDGKIDLKDAKTVLKMAVGIPVELPAE